MCPTGLPETGRKLGDCWVTPKLGPHQLVCVGAAGDMLMVPVPCGWLMGSRIPQTVLKKCKFDSDIQLKGR
jgi:hypothetical protein